MTEKARMTLDAARELKPVYQDKFGLDWTKPDAGNCLQACLATVLGLSLDDVPHFVTHEQHQDDMNRWLMKRFGLYVICFEDSEPWPWVQGYYLLSGQGARGAEHVVVYKDGKLAHDPIGPNGPGLEQIKNVWLFVAADPAAARASGGERVCRAVTSDGWCLCEPDDEGDCSTCGETASTTHACPEGFRRSTPSPGADVVEELRSYVRLHGEHHSTCLRRLKGKRWTTDADCNCWLSHLDEVGTKASGNTIAASPTATTEEER